MHPLALAVNRDELVREGLKGWGTPGDSPILPNSWAYAKQSWPSDPARAGQMLDAAGWKVGASGAREKGGQALAFTLLTDNDPLRAGVATVLARQFTAIGAVPHPNASKLVGRGSRTWLAEIPSQDSNHRDRAE